MAPKGYFTINKNTNRGYRNLDVWKEAVDLYYSVDDIQSISFKVKAQVEGSVFAVSSNIAEDYCRRSIKENIQFVNIALASLGENYSQIFILFNASKVLEEKFKEFDNRHYSLENKLIKFNKSMIEKLKNGDYWKNDYILRKATEKYNT